MMDNKELRVQAASLLEPTFRARQTNPSFQKPVADEVGDLIEAADQLANFFINGAKPERPTE